MTSRPHINQDVLVFEKKFFRFCNERKRLYKHTLAKAQRKQNAEKSQTKMLKHHKVGMMSKSLFKFEILKLQAGPT